jgi:hypothetical protein
MDTSMGRRKAVAGVTSLLPNKGNLEYLAASFNQDKPQMPNTKLQYKNHPSLQASHKGVLIDRGQLRVGIRTTPGQPQILH